MAVSKSYLIGFEKRYGVSLDEVSMNLNDPLLNHSSEKRSDDVSDVSPEIYGRGYVSFGKFVSASEADKSTLEIIRNW